MGRWCWPPPPAGRATRTSAPTRPSGAPRPSPPSSTSPTLRYGRHTSSITSACSAAAAKIRIDVAIRDAIEDGLIDGPRLLAAGPELTVTGGLGDGRKLHLPLESFGVPVDGPDEMLRMVRLCLREGVDTIKLNISGDFGTDSAPADAAVMTDGEIAVAVVGAHLSGMPLNGELKSFAARFLDKTTTTADYRLFALAGTTPPKRRCSVNWL